MISQGRETITRDRGKPLLVSKGERETPSNNTRERGKSFDITRDRGKPLVVSERESCVGCAPEHALVELGLDGVALRESPRDVLLCLADLHL